MWVNIKDFLFWNSFKKSYEDGKWKYMAIKFLHYTWGIIMLSQDKLWLSIVILWATTE